MPKIASSWFTLSATVVSSPEALHFDAAHNDWQIELIQIVEEVTQRSRVPQ